MVIVVVLEQMTTFDNKQFFLQMWVGGVMLSISRLFQVSKYCEPS